MILSRFTYGLRLGWESLGLFFHHKQLLWYPALYGAIAILTGICAYATAGGFVPLPGDIDLPVILSFCLLISIDMIMTMASLIVTAGLIYHYSNLALSAPPTLKLLRTVAKKHLVLIGILALAKTLIMAAIRAGQELTMSIPSGFLAFTAATVITLTVILLYLLDEYLLIVAIQEPMSLVRNIRHSLWLALMYLPETSGCGVTIILPLLPLFALFLLAVIHPLFHVVAIIAIGAALCIASAASTVALTHLHKEYCKD